MEMIDPTDAARIQELFHGLIRSRAREGNLSISHELPSISELALDAEPEWFPVPGMYGGFSYRLSRRGREIVLIAESWCRVVEGSGMRHIISPTQVILDEQGFV